LDADVHTAGGVHHLGEAAEADLGIPVDPDARLLLQRLDQQGRPPNAKAAFTLFSP